MAQKVTSFYISPWSLSDPLCQSQSLSYIKCLAADKHRFALMTLENAKFAASSEEISKTKKRLEKENIFWYPVKWQSGNSVFDKISSIIKTFSMGAKICFRHKPRIIHSRSSLPTFLSVPLAKVFRITFLYDADSLLSEEYADTNHLSRESSGFKLLARNEAKARRAAKQIIVLTETLKKDYQEKFGVKTSIEVIPCCVNTAKFAFDAKAREKRRRELNLTDETLFVYVGKYGSWYLVDETIDFFKTAIEAGEPAKLLIVTQDAPEVFRKVLHEKSVVETSYFITSAAHEEVTEWLSAADVGLALIKPLPSKRGSSPVKTSEYLVNGLPIVSNSGIGDLDALIENEQVGAVLRGFTEKDYAEALKKIEDLLKNKNLREHCRRTAYEYFDLETVGGARYRRLYRELLGEK